MTSGPKLTPTQVAEIKQELVPANQTRPYRFLLNGQGLNISTGALTPKNVNVMYQTVYWNFTAATANKIAKWLDVKVIPT